VKKLLCQNKLQTVLVLHEERFDTVDTALAAFTKQSQRESVQQDGVKEVELCKVVASYAPDHQLGADEMKSDRHLDVGDDAVAKQWLIVTLYETIDNKIDCLNSESAKRSSVYFWAGIGVALILLAAAQFVIPRIS